MLKPQVYVCVSKRGMRTHNQSLIDETDIDKVPRKDNKSQLNISFNC